jgi:hypothetical protein
MIAPPQSEAGSGAASWPTFMDVLLRSADRGSFLGALLGSAAAPHLLVLHEAPASCVNCRQHNNINRLGQGAGRHAIGTRRDLDYRDGELAVAVRHLVNRDFMATRGLLSGGYRDNQVTSEINLRATTDA